MAVNQFRQRLMAAGASPERAGKLVEERSMRIPELDRLPGATPTPTRAPASTTRPQGPNEWYNEDYLEQSEALLPGAFRAPKLGDPNFVKYFDFVFGKGAYSKVAPLTLSQAPNYSTAKSSQEPFDIFVVNAVQSGASWPQVLGYVKDAVNKKAISWPTEMLDTEALDYAKSIWNEYNRYGKPNEKAYQEAIKQNKDFQYRMPDRRLKYGTMTNFDVGTVDILTNPRALSLFNSFAAKNPDSRNQAKYKAWLASEFTRLGRTPWTDERDRRDSLKGRRVKSGGG
jgi:hypothetical protein